MLLHLEKQPFIESVESVVDHKLNKRHLIISVSSQISREKYYWEINPEDLSIDYITYYKIIKRDKSSPHRYAKVLQTGSLCETHKSVERLKEYLIKWSMPYVIKYHKGDYDKKETAFLSRLFKILKRK